MSFVPDDRLVDAADRLLARADVLIAVEPTDGSSELPAHELARALAMWSIALRQLSESGDNAWTTMSSGFPDYRGGGTDAFGVERAQLAVLTATMIGDTVLDAFAWAELVRRGQWEGWNATRRRSGDRIPVLWAALMAALDAQNAADDAMRGPARYLDVTLDAARDLFVAHRDPELVLLRSASNVGRFSLDLTTFDESRQAAADELLGSLPLPSQARRLDGFPGRRQRELEMEVLAHLSDRLGAEDRAKLRRIYRLAGFVLPDLFTIAEPVRQLVDLHMERRGMTPPELSS